MRFATDTGGTFTDLIVEDDDGQVKMYKASTTPLEPVRGVLNALQKAADDYAVSLPEFMAKADTFIHGTTHALNAIITGKTARTAFLTTAGHPEILVLREGGRSNLFDYSHAFPKPYIPRELTFEVPERIDAEGNIIEPLDKAALITLITKLREKNVEAVAVSLLWSVVNADHERMIGELLAEHLPNVPVTLSSQLNPIIGEYRRASSVCIDASLKPLMTRYLSSLTNQLNDNGFSGRVLMLTSGGGMLDAETVAQAPIHAINSGPSMAPVAGRFYGQLEGSERNVIVGDTGGTTYDVSLVRDGRISVSRDLWIGEPYHGHMTGFPSIDVKSVGAGGGSIAWVDNGGLLRVGPQSAGAEPGPVCYGRGGVYPTVTDASVVLGHLDANNFLGGAMVLNADAARDAVAEYVAKPMQLSIEDAAVAILEVATENMVSAIADITVKQGVDPEDAVLIGGGGAAGLNSAWIARRLGCKRLVIPETGPALSATGAIMSDLSAEYGKTSFTSSDNFNFATVADVLNELQQKCREFIDGPGKAAVSSDIDFVVQARYKHQVWDIELPLLSGEISCDNDLDQLVQQFHQLHERIFAVRDPQSAVEFLYWQATVRCRLRENHAVRLSAAQDNTTSGTRNAYFKELGATDVPVYDFSALETIDSLPGPAIVESPFTTVVIPPGAQCRKGEFGNIVIFPQAEGAAAFDSAISGGA